MDLARARTASPRGEPLGGTQEMLTEGGDAIEVRVYAEDPSQDDLPQAGALLLYREPSIPGIRIDSGVTEGVEISVHFDPLIAKVIVDGSAREVARRRAVEALR